MNQSILASIQQHFLIGFNMVAVLAGIFSVWKFSWRVGQLEKVVTNGLTNKVQQIHDDVLIIKTKCRMCEDEK